MLPRSAGPAETGASSKAAAIRVVLRPSPAADGDSSSAPNATPRNTLHAMMLVNVRYGVLSTKWELAGISGDTATARFTQKNKMIALDAREQISVKIIRCGLGSVSRGDLQVVELSTKHESS